MRPKSSWAEIAAAHQAFVANRQLGRIGAELGQMENHLNSMITQMKQAEMKQQLLGDARILLISLEDKVESLVLEKDKDLAYSQSELMLVQDQSEFFEQVPFEQFEDLDRLRKTKTNLSMELEKNRTVLSQFPEELERCDNLYKFNTEFEQLYGYRDAKWAETILANNSKQARVNAGYQLNSFVFAGFGMLLILMEIFGGISEESDGAVGGFGVFLVLAGGLFLAMLGKKNTVDMYDGFGNGRPEHIVDRELGYNAMFYKTKSLLEQDILLSLTEEKPGFIEGWNNAGNAEIQARETLDHADSVCYTATMMKSAEDTFGIMTHEVITELIVYREDYVANRGIDKPSYPSSHYWLSQRTIQ